MTWFSITPSAPITIGNLTPVGQNSGQVGCRFPPNGHHLAGCLNLPTNCQLWGPFWWKFPSLYVVLPQTIYTVDVDRGTLALPDNFYRMQWVSGQWQVQPQHQEQPIELIGGRYLIEANTLKSFWHQGHWNSNQDLALLPWTHLTLSHNSREDYQVKDEGGFFAEMTTLLDPEWAIVVKIKGDYTPPVWSSLGAGGTPVVIQSERRGQRYDWLGGPVDNTTGDSTGGILLTGALWQQGTQKSSIPYPNLPIKAYAADLPIPWQSWTKVKTRHHPNQKMQVLTPGEWLTPAGAVYLWEDKSSLFQSGPLSDVYHRDALGYGHLWLF